MSQPKNIAVQLYREHAGQSWGFRLQGGTNFTTPLSIQMVCRERDPKKVSPGGLAERNGLRGGDCILQINGKNMECLEHEDAKRVILMCSDHMDVVVKRGAIGIWQPKVTPLSELRPSERQAMPDGDIMTQRTSLAATPQSSAYANVGSSYNNKPKPFASFGSSNSSSVSSVNNNKSVNSSNFSQNQFGSQQQQQQQQFQPQQQQAKSAIRSVRAPTSLPPGEKQTGVYMTCTVCGTLIAGVFVKIQGAPMHPECFKCFRCGKNLKNQGHFNIEGNLYCEEHATSLYSQ